ncbi:MAG: hypothetical protein ACXQT0_04770 [Candidatus Methanofastidiosia archaeon]
MQKLFCDDCGREIKTSLSEHSVEITDPITERKTEITFTIKGLEWDTSSDKFAKRFPIEHLCKTCAIKHIQDGLKAFMEVYEWDGKS